MSMEVLLWICGATVIPLIGWGVHITWSLFEIRSITKELLDMHKRPDDYGFGTDKQTKVIEDNTRAMESLTHYIKWLAVKQGETPPPPLD